MQYNFIHTFSDVPDLRNLYVINISVRTDLCFILINTYTKTFYYYLYKSCKGPFNNNHPLNLLLHILLSYP